MTLKAAGYSVQEIRKRLYEENIVVSEVALYQLLWKFRDHGTIADLPKPPVVKVLSSEHLNYIDNSLRQNDELTGRQLHALLCTKWPTLDVSVSTVKRARKSLGWVSSRPKYSHLVREVNMEKRLSWCQDKIASNETFQNVIFTDECTVQLDRHGRLCFRKIGEPRKLKPKPKHPVKVHLWGGISKHGATPLVIFTGIMNAEKYCEILDNGLIPFIESKFPNGDYRFQQDNDPKHVSRLAQSFFDEKGINWWKTPPESPDLNPIENVWGHLKHFLRSEWKPTTLAELQAGITDCSYNHGCSYMYMYM